MRIWERYDRSLKRAEWRRFSRVNPNVGGNAKQRRAARRRWNHFLRTRGGWPPGWHPLTPEEEAHSLEMEACIACIKGNMEEAVTEAFVANNGKVPYTTEGVAKIEASIRDVLERAEADGVLTPPPPDKVTMHPLTDEDRRERRVRGTIEFMHPVHVTGTIKI